MPQRHISIVLIVVGTIATIGLLYMGTLAWCGVKGQAVSPEILTAMKDVGLVAIGALTGLLARTATGPEPTSPTPVTVTNPPSDPVNTQET